MALLINNNKHSQTITDSLPYIWVPIYMCMLLESAYSKWWFDDYDHEDKNETASLKLNNDYLNDVIPTTYKYTLTK